MLMCGYLYSIRGQTMCFPFVVLRLTVDASRCRQRIPDHMLLGVIFVMVIANWHSRPLVGVVTSSLPDIWFVAQVKFILISFPS